MAMISASAMTSSASRTREYPITRRVVSSALRSRIDAAMAPALTMTPIASRRSDC